MHDARHEGLDADLHYRDGAWCVQERSERPLTAAGKLGHVEGEVVLTRAAKAQNLIQMIPTLASCSFDEIADAARGGQTQWLQLCAWASGVPSLTPLQTSTRTARSPSASSRRPRRAGSRVSSSLSTRRSSVAVRRCVGHVRFGRLTSKDMRMKFADEGASHQKGDKTVDKSQGAARAISSFIDPGLCWADIPWFKSITKMPIILKGVQCWEGPSGDVADRC